jgi:hypothetical protein
VGKRVLFIVIITLIMSCVNNDVITGNKVVSSIKLNMSRYANHLILDVDSTVKISRGAPSITITSEENSLRDFVIDTTDGVLSISRLRDYSYIVDSCRVYITLPNIDTIEILSGDVSTTLEPTLIKSIKLSNNSKLNANIVHTDTLSIVVVDSSQIILKGESTVLNYKQTSKASQNLDSLIVSYCNIDISTPTPPKLYIYSELMGKLESPNSVTLLWKTPIVYVDCIGGGDILYDSSVLVDTTDIEN